MPATPPYFPPETYNGHVARYKTDASGNVVGFIKPNSNDEVVESIVIAKTDPVTGGIEIYGAGKAVGVDSEATLRKARDANAPAYLLNDISLTKGVSLGNGAFLDLNGFTLSAAGLHNFNLVTTSNAVWNGNTGLDGVFLLCADEGQSGDGTINRIAGAPATMTWAAAGDAAGAAVNVSGADGKYTLASANGKQIYIVVVNSRLPASEAKSVTVSETTGAKTMTWARATNVLTITETAHGRLSGDPVTLFGTNVAGCWFINQVTDANTYVIRNDVRADASGSGSVFGVRDVTYQNGTQDANYSNHTTTPNNFTTLGAVFNSLNGLKLRNMRGLDTQKYCFLLTHVAAWDIENISFDSPSDGVHINSPARSGRVARLRGKTGDNTLCYGVSDYKETLINYPTEAGEHHCLIGSFEDIDAEECYSPVRFYGAASWYVGGGEGKKVRGTVTTSVGITLKGDTTVIGASTEQNARDITIEDISLRRSQSGVFQVFVCDMTGDVRGITIDGFDVSEPAASNGCIQFNTPIKDATIANPRSAGFYTAGVARQWSGAAIVVLSNTATMDTLRLRGFRKFKTENSVTASPSIVYNVNTANSIGHLILEDAVIEHISATGSRLCLVRNNGILKKLSVFNADLSGAEVFRQAAGTAQAGNIVEIRGLRAFKGANTGALYLCSIDGSNPGEYIIDDVSGDATELIRNGNSNVQNVNLRMTSIAAAITALAVPVTGPSYRAYSPDVPITLSLLDRAVAGQMCIAKTALGTIPINTLAVNDGSGSTNSWKAVHNTTLTY